jgi:hypothetical protein
MSTSEQNHPFACRRDTPWGWIFLAFALMAVVLLWQEHRAHLLGVIPYLILLSCPLMHLLHRRRHGHGSHRQEDRHA